MIEYIRTCQQNIELSREVIGSKGDKYVVQYIGGEWYCTCPASQYRKGDCKHIKQVKATKCDWNWEAFMGCHAEANPDNTCPKCGGETNVIKVGV